MASSVSAVRSASKLWSISLSACKHIIPLVPSEIRVAQYWCRHLWLYHSHSAKQCEARNHLRTTCRIQESKCGGLRLCLYHFAATRALSGCDATFLCRKIFVVHSFPGQQSVTDAFCVKNAYNDFLHYWWVITDDTTNKYCSDWIDFLLTWGRAQLQVSCILHDSYTMRSCVT